MKRIKMKDNTTKFIWNGDNCVGKYTELIEQYHYDSEEEKMEHKIEMELNGWNDSGQVMEMISGSLMPGAKNPPVHVWFGSYYKTIKIWRSKQCRCLSGTKSFWIVQNVRDVSHKTV